jgi:hypothetical protein
MKPRLLISDLDEHGVPNANKCNVCGLVAGAQMANHSKLCGVKRL